MQPSGSSVDLLLISFASLKVNEMQNWHQVRLLTAPYCQYVSRQRYHLATVALGSAQDYLQWKLRHVMLLHTGDQLCQFFKS